MSHAADNESSLDNELPESEHGNANEEAAAPALSSGTHRQLDAPHQLLDDDLIELVAEAAVLDAALDVGIVVHFDNIEFVAQLLEVDAVETVADGIGRPQRHIDDGGRHLFDRPGLEPSLREIARRVVLDDLPVFGRHEVLAGEQRLAIENADAPVEFGVDEFMYQDEIGLLEQPDGDVDGLFGVLGLEYAARERAVGNLDHQRIRHLPFQHLGVALAQDHGLRHRDVVRLHHLGEKHLVGAFQYRIRIVEHRHAFTLGLLGEVIGVVIHLRGLADEQRIVFGELGVIFFLDQVDVDVELLAHLDELLQRFRIRRRQLLVGVVQNRKIAARLLRRRRHAPAPAVRGVKRLDEKRLLLGGYVVERHGPDRRDLPGIAAFQFHPQQRAGKLIEDLPRHILQNGKLALPEENVELEGAAGRIGALRQNLLHQLVEIFEIEAVNRFAAEVAQGLDAGNAAVPARLCQQRTVITQAQIAIAAAQVDYFFVLGLEEFRVGDVLLRLYDIRVGKMRFPILAVFYHDSMR